MLDPKLVEDKIGELEKAANKADKSQLEDSMQTETVEEPSAAQTFDLFDELAGRRFRQELGCEKLENHSHQDG